MQTRLPSSEIFWLLPGKAKDVVANVNARFPHLCPKTLTGPKSVLNNSILNGVTPLHWAAEQGYLEQVPPTILTAENITMDGCWWTPLHLASKYGHLDQLQPSLLCRKTLTHQNSTQVTPLHIAAKFGHLVQVPSAVFYDKDPQDILCKDDQGQTFLHEAAYTGHIGQLPCQFIKAHIMTENRYGVTPLMIAAGHGNLRKLPAEVVTEANLLVNNGACTALHNAARGGYLEDIPLKLLCQNLLTVAGRKTVLEIGMKHYPEEMSFLQGQNLPEACENFAPTAWWNTHQQTLISKNALECTHAKFELELF